MKKLGFTILGIVLFAATGFAQVTTSNIRGLVTDSQGEPLPGANVVAEHTPTGTIYGAATNFDGRFNLLNLRVGGPYKVTISYIGFQEKVFNDVFLELGKTADTDVALIENSEQLQEVVVTGDSSGTFGSDRTGAQTSVGRRELTRLPTITRSAQDFTRLEPTATSTGSFAGRNDQFNNFSLDGAIFNNPFGLDAATPGGQTEAQPISLDAIDQIQVAIAPYDVTLSGFTGASVNAVTKSGANKFTGTAYGFFRNEDFTGGKVKGEDVFKPELKQSQYGISIGGPIVKNKVFFFANFERDVRTDLGSAFVPNRGTGAINESRVLATDLETVQAGLLSIGYDPGRFEGFTFASESTKGILKLDWNINQKNRAALIYNFLTAAKEKPAHPTALGFRGPNANTLQFENSGYEINNNIQSFQFELNSTLSDKIANKFQMGYTFFDDFRDPLSEPMPAFRIQDGAGTNYIVAGHEPFSIHNRLEQRVFQFTNNLNFFSGSHTFTAGISFEKFTFDNSFNLGVYGYGFGPGVYVEYPAGGYVGAFFGDFADMAAFNIAISSGMLADAFANAQNVFDTNNADNSWSLAETNVGQGAFYVQDEWSVNESFKLTYGVRLDKPMYFNTEEKIQENIDRKGTYDPTVDYFDPETGQTVNLSSTELPSNSILFSPRLGFNWDIKGDKTSQLRGGTGLFTGRFPFVWLGNQVQGIDFFFYQVVDPDFKWPQVWRTSLGVDHKLENGLVLTADLSYTKDINGAHVQNWGLGDPSQVLNTTFDGRAVYDNADKAMVFGTPTNAYVFSNSNKGRIWNVALKAQKTFESGMYASLAYSYLNAKDVNSIEAEITGDAFAFNPALGNVNDDVPAFSKYGDTHRIIGVVSKEFKYGGDKWGTTISTFFEYAQGGRFNYTYGGDINNDGSNLNDLLYIPTASEVGDMLFSGAPAEQAEQAAAFEAFIQQDKYLSERRGQYTERYGALAPWRSRWDIKILQDYNFKVSEDRTNTIQFSIDILNVGNLISSDWGLVQQPNNVQPIGVTLDPVTYEPTYTFNTELQETFVYDSSLLSRWQAQFGLRYIF